MGTTTRHFNALMRKNFINWKREPCSAVCQLLTPGLLMLILVYVRSRIEPSSVNAEALGALASPQYTIDVTNVGGIPQLDTASTNARLEPFMTYYFGSLQKVSNITFLPYDVTTNTSSPLMFNPENCLVNSSFVIPHIPSNIIAVVAPESNEVSQNVYTYLNLLQEQWQISSVNNLTIQSFASMDALQSYISSDSYLYPDAGICFGVEITQTGNSFTASYLFDDQIQYGGSVAVGIPVTTKTGNSYALYTSTPDIKDFNMLSGSGYAFIQNIVANAILQVQTKDNTASITLLNIPIPAAVVIVDQFSQVLSGIFPFFTLLIYMGPIYNCVYGIVKEKEQKSKESMRMMGLNDLPYWLSWFAFYSIQSSIIAFVGWICLCINVIPNGGKGYIFLYLWLFGESVFGQIVFYQALFTRSKYAGLIACLIFFMVSFVNIPIATAGSVGLKGFLSLIPQVALQQMAVIWADYESAQIGITSLTAHEVVNNYTFAEGLWMFIPALFAWMALGFYLDAVLPKEFGSRRHPCFIFFPSTYKCCCKKERNQDDDQEDERKSTFLKKDYEDGGGMEVKNLKPENYEPVAAEIARQALDGQYLRIEGLEKTYDNGFQAVKGINLKIYQNQIFALLGQNGAGKSTTISMLTGLIEATKGSAIAFNDDMFKEAEKVRQIMGVCPQHDILFDNLTPIEHLSVFYDFKGGKPELKQKEIDDLIRDIGLTIDKDKRAGSLSGGNKRKLSVAIALCGGSKLVLLDEPTAGMDLGARRDLWNMLKNYRRDKIIILTTHYMDEADVLGDRIGIMAKGQMMCLGTSLFLKKRFGAGYKITMVKATKQPNQLIGPYLNENLGNVELLSEVSSEITFQVSNESAQHFKQFFNQFDREMQNLGIISYGVSITTLEEVFLKINQEFQINIGNSAVEDRLTKQTGQLIEDLNTPNADENILPNQIVSRESSTSLNGKLQHETKELQLSGQSQFSKDFEMQESRERLVGNATLSTTVKALLIKRYHLYKRDKTGICCEVAVPFIMVIIGCLLNGIDLSQKSYTTIITPATNYPTPQRIVMNTESIDLTINQIAPLEFYNNLPGGTANWFCTNYNNQPVDLFTPGIFYDTVYNASLINSTIPYRYGSYQFYKSDPATNQYQFASYINLTSPMVTAYFPQYMYNSILQTVAGTQLTAQTVPYPPMFQLTQRSSSQNAFLYSGFVGFAFAFLPCAMIGFILIERVENLRHMQLISGMSLPSYWLSNMIADIIKVYIPIIMIILISVIFDSNYDGVWILFMLLPLALVPFTYCTSFLFQKESTAQIITLLSNYFVCCVMAPLIFVLQFIPQTFKLGGILRWAFCIFPGYCVINGILWSSNGIISLEIRKTNPDYPQLSDNIWAMCNLGGDALILVLHFVIDTLILVAIEMDLFSCLKSFSVAKIPDRNQNLVLDQDVEREEQRVRNQDCNDVIKVIDFRKFYTTAVGEPFLAVERIGFGVDYGECFALLGVNGAGKSTTFKSLTADTTPTTGDITIASFNIQTQFEQARQLIGYCPQKDAIFTLMTVEEHLWFYARIKGIPVELHNKIVETAIVELNLSDHRLKPAGTLSGGNKRKLSVAIATLGNPPIILLDEPSAGMDPEARRFMWTVVERISQRDKKCAVILTTHSMEEAEALSTKMGIMVRGGIFKCFGSSQYIKDKYGTGYEVEIKIRKPTYADLEQVAQNLGFSQSIDQRFDLNQAKTLARNQNIDEMLLEQIKEQGLGSDLVFESLQGINVEIGSIRISNFATYIYTMQFGLKVVTLLAKHFAQVELIEQCSDFFKFRIPREDKTIGSLFGLIEEAKKTCNISEYSVNQTTLEQIFQNFANQSILEDKSTLTFTIDTLENLRLVEERRSTIAKRIMGQVDQ